MLLGSVPPLNACTKGELSSGSVPPLNPSKKKGICYLAVACMPCFG